MATQVLMNSVAIFIFILIIQGATSTTFTFKNNCPFTVWPGTLHSAAPPLPQTGFELANGASVSLDAPPKWSGRMWARTRCSTDASGKFSCLSADCGTGQIPCNGAGASPPASLVEFTLQGAGGNDFYDTSLVDGFNLPVSIAPQGGSGCQVSNCPVDINARCPPELRVTAPDGGVVGCKSACLAFGTDEFCCKGAFNDPNKCQPSEYSKVVKAACPKAYSYPYDDKTSTFTCLGPSGYVITFCP